MDRGTSGVCVQCSLGRLPGVSGDSTAPPPLLHWPRNSGWEQDLLHPPAGLGCSLKTFLWGAQPSPPLSSLCPKLARRHGQSCVQTGESRACSPVGRGEPSLHWGQLARSCPGQEKLSTGEPPAPAQVRAWSRQTPARPQLVLADFTQLARQHGQAPDLRAPASSSWSGLKDRPPSYLWARDATIPCHLCPEPAVPQASTTNLVSRLAEALGGWRQGLGGRGPEVTNTFCFPGNLDSPPKVGASQSQGLACLRDRQERGVPLPTPLPPSSLTRCQGLTGCLVLESGYPRLGEEMH